MSESGEWGMGERGVASEREVSEGGVRSNVTMIMQWW